MNEGALLLTYRAVEPGPALLQRTIGGANGYLRAGCRAAGACRLFRANYVEGG